MGVSLLHFLLIILTFSVALFVPIMVELDDPSLSMVDRQALGNAFISLHERLWPALLGVLALLLLHVAIVSHRICGPLHRFRQIFKSIEEGHFISIPTGVRKGDYLQEEAQAINDMVVSLRARMEELESQHESVRGALDELKRAVEGNSGGNAADSLRRLEERFERVRTNVKRLGGAAQEPPPTEGSARTPVQTVTSVDSVDKVESEGCQ